jgi:hypothetical protein
MPLAGLIFMSSGSGLHNLRKDGKRYYSLCLIIACLKRIWWLDSCPVFSEPNPDIVTITWMYTPFSCMNGIRMEFERAGENGRYTQLCSLDSMILRYEVIALDYCALNYSTSILGTRTLLYKYLFASATVKLSKRIPALSLDGVLQLSAWIQHLTNSHFILQHSVSQKRKGLRCSQKLKRNSLQHCIIPS